ncbi:MAG: spore coat associated protein CotJA [Lachnospiraceae bacterium]|nr:spore coat associated protein CotJA [Lachnospiraceae bacterium]
MDFCACKNIMPALPTLAMAAVPVQEWETPCDPAQSLKQGTVFPSLVLPFFAAKEKLGGVHHG